MQSLTPVQSAERIHLIDALRGIAILGIFIANLSVGFSFYDASLPNTGPWFHPWDKQTVFFEHLLIEGKFYSIFSLLFGWGLAIQLKRSELKGLTPVSFVRRRLLFMFLLGLAHLLLLWTGDIVAFYALVGFMFLWIRKWKDRTLFITAIILLLSPILLYYLKMKFDWMMAPAGILYETGEKIDIHVSGIGGFEEFVKKLKYGNYIDHLQTLLSGVFYRFGDLVFQSRIPKVLGMFVLGYLLGKDDRYKQIIGNTRLLWSIAITGLLLGLPCNYMLARYMEEGKYYSLGIEGLYQSLVYAFGVAPLALAYVALFFLAARTKAGKKCVTILQPVGKMAFSNYIIHSLVGCFVFYGFGFAMLREVGPVYTTILAFLVFIGQIIFSTLWLKYFNYGPVEWLWRSGTYGKWQKIQSTTLR